MNRMEGLELARALRTGDARLDTLLDTLSTQVGETFSRIAQLHDELSGQQRTTDAKEAELVKRNKLQQRVFFSSFIVFNLIRIRRLLPEVPVGLLLTSGLKGRLSYFISSALLRYQSLHPRLSDVTLHLVKQTHKKGRPIFVYTVNEEEDMRRLFEIGVDGIFTADPVLAQTVLGKVRQSATANAAPKNTATKDPTV